MLAVTPAAYAYRVLLSVAPYNKGPVRVIPAEALVSESFSALGRLQAKIPGIVADWLGLVPEPLGADFRRPHGVIIHLPARSQTPSDENFFRASGTHVVEALAACLHEPGASEREAENPAQRRAGVREPGRPVVRQRRPVRFSYGFPARFPVTV